MREPRVMRIVAPMLVGRMTGTEQEAAEQLASYLDGAGLQEGWLVLFDLRSSLSWERRLYLRQDEQAGKIIHIVGC